MRWVREGLVQVESGWVGEPAAAAAAPRRSVELGFSSISMSAHAR